MVERADQGTGRARSRPAELTRAPRNRTEKHQKKPRPSQLIRERGDRIRPENQSGWAQSALPTELQPEDVGLTGLEPATSHVAGEELPAITTGRIRSDVSESQAMEPPRGHSTDTFAEK